MVASGKCLYCGGDYRKLRSDGKFCKDSCRVQYNDLPKLMKAKAEKAMDLMAQMRELAEKYPHLVAELDTQMSRVHQKSTLEWFAVSTLPNLPESKKP